MQQLHGECQTYFDSLKHDAPVSGVPDTLPRAAQSGGVSAASSVPSDSKVGRPSSSALRKAPEGEGAVSKPIKFTKFGSSSALFCESPKKLEPTAPFAERSRPVAEVPLGCTTKNNLSVDSGSNHVVCVVCPASTMVPLILVPAALENAHGAPQYLATAAESAGCLRRRNRYVHSCICHKNRMTLLFAVSGLLVCIVAGGLSEDTATDADGEADGPDGKPKKAGSVHKGGSTSSVTWRLSAATQMVLVIYPSRANTRLSRYLLTRHFIEQLGLIQFVRQLV